jgi:hypothetical protein
MDTILTIRKKNIKYKTLYQLRMWYNVYFFQFYLRNVIGLKCEKKTLPFR